MTTTVPTTIRGLRIGDVLTDPSLPPYVRERHIRGIEDDGDVIVVHLDRGDWIVDDWDLAVTVRR